MGLPKIQPSGDNPTTKDFVTMQSQWASQLQPVIDEVNKTDGINVGSVLMWTTSIAPQNYLICAGQIVLQSQYQPLFLVIGTAYNTGGEPPGWFRLPMASGPFRLIIKYLPGGIQ